MICRWDTAPLLGRLHMQRVFAPSCSSGRRALLSAPMPPDRVMQAIWPERYTPSSWCTFTVSVYLQRGACQDCDCDVEVCRSKVNKRAKHAFAHGCLVAPMGLAMKTSDGDDASNIFVWAHSATGHQIRFRSGLSCTSAVCDLLLRSAACACFHTHKMDAVTDKHGSWGRHCSDTSMHCREALRRVCRSLRVCLTHASIVSVLGVQWPVCVCAGPTLHCSLMSSMQTQV